MRLTVDPLSHEDVRVQQGISGPLFWFLVLLLVIVVVGVPMLLWQLAWLDADHLEPVQ